MSADGWLERAKFMSLFTPLLSASRRVLLLLRQELRKESASFEMHKSSLLTFLTALLFITAVCWPAPVYAKQRPWGDAPPFIVALGGISFPSFLFARFFGAGQANIEEYLANALHENWGYTSCVANFADCTIQAIPWGGDLNDGVALHNYILQTKQILTRLHQQFPKRDIVVVAHSWGSVVAYQAITELENEGSFGRDAIALLATLGSPLASQCSATLINFINTFAPAVLGKELIGNPHLKKPNSVRRWINYWMSTDKISGPASLVDPVNLPENSDMSFLAEDISCSVFGLVASAQWGVLEVSHGAYYVSFIGLIEQDISESIGENRIALGCRHLFYASASVPNGYGQAHNVLSAAGELLLRATCANTNVGISVGNGAETQYVYHLGYALKGSSWEEIRYAGSRKVGDLWYVGEAHVELVRSPAELGERNYFLAYVCTWTGDPPQGNGWKCGCHDSTCNESLWQLQGFRRE